MAKPLTIKEAKIIEGLHGTMSLSAIGRKVGRSRKTVARYLVKQGFHEPAKKGGWRKGVNPPHLIDYQYKKGRKSERSLPIGHITVKDTKKYGRYQIIKTEEGWRNLGLVVLEKHLGRRLKRTERVVYLDGNRMNVSIENLSVGDRTPPNCSGEMSREKVLKGHETKRRLKAEREARFKEALSKQPKSLDMTGKMGRMYFGMKFD